MAPAAGPQRPSSPAEKRKRDEDNETDSGPHPSQGSPLKEADDRSKKPRVIGPTLPPNLGADEGSSSSDSDDDYGPSLPPTGADADLEDSKSAAGAEESRATSKAEEAKPTRRDDWMLQPPDHGDWSSRVDPTKLKSRKFNTGRSAGSKPLPGAPVAGTWTETAEEKRKRLEAEVMGIKAPANTAAEPGIEGSEHDAAMSKRVREYNEKKRGKTLYAQHQSQDSKEEEDDPSARPFDKEKDIRGPTKINHAQRRELLNRASDFNTRFSGGKFL
ncbi:hypothetical protein AJ79_03849 [Helicocarpus griseus UAMH5409]|uniref:DUF3752 domain-containing protein n=1 Tax=Helicocarpus griseus UAMH5409 TaxID=1447875 RepID=A0A2B7XWY4_9EURO|nr:hypothetical protein AJ79_03849 [Helicocarpus griseus UAMH5409]